MPLRRLAVQRTLTRWGVCRLVAPRGLVMAAMAWAWTAAACWMAWCCPVAPPALGLAAVAPVTLGLRCVTPALHVLLHLRLQLAICRLLRRVWLLVTPVRCQL